MASFIARRTFTTSARRFAAEAEHTLKGESKRNPEIMVRCRSRPPRPGSIDAR